jgi:hypothetical protein
MLRARLGCCPVACLDFHDLMWDVVSARRLVARGPFLLLYLPSDLKAT